MLKIKSRYYLKSSEKKKLREKIVHHFKSEEIFSIPKKRNIEKITLDEGVEIFLIENNPEFFKIGDENFVPFLTSSQLEAFPKVIVDMGAIPHVSRGADIMRPGITEIDGKFDKGDLIVILDEKFKKPIAVGRSLLNSEEIKVSEKGRVIENIHYVSDKFWRIFHS